MIKLTSGSRDKKTLKQRVHKAVESYLDHVDGEQVTGLYDLVLSEVEAPLLEVVMRYAGNNQSRAAALLGMNRGTLRKKLKQYKLI